MLKTKTWILIFSLLMLVCGILCWFLFSQTPTGSVVQILQDGVCIREIDLSRVTEPYTIDITGFGGTNRILVEPGRIRMLEADCPDQICVHHGWLTDSAAPIVCLPHRLTIQLTDSTGPDGAVQ